MFSSLPHFHFKQTGSFNLLCFQKNMSYWFIDSLIDWFYWSACALWDYILDFLWLSLLHTQNSGWWTIVCTVNNDISRVDNKTVLTIYEIKNHVTTVLWSTLDKSLCIGTCELVNCYIFNWTSQQVNNSITPNNTTDLMV